MQEPDELVAKFRANGRKVTPQRVAVFNALHGATTHPTAEAVWEEVSSRLPGLSLRTVYQTLHDLADMGELQQLDVGTGSVRFDPHVEDHDHFVCDDCGRVEDLPPAKVDSRAAAAMGHMVRRSQVTHRGSCSHCAVATPIELAATKK